MHVFYTVSPGQVMWDLWWIKRHWCWFSPSTSVSPANHSTDCCTLIIRGWDSRPSNGLGSTAPQRKQRVIHSRQLLWSQVSYWQLYRSRGAMISNETCWHLIRKSSPTLSRLPAALGPGIHSASNRNECQKHKNNNVSGE
jgi:hypothetical protein